MEKLEQICFNIISHVGLARSCYIEAIKKAKDGDYEGAEACMKNGQDEYLQGHNAHFELIASEASGEHLEVPLLLVHAEDQMMSAETFHIIAEELTDAYKKIDALSKKSETD